MWIIILQYENLKILIGLFVQLIGGNPFQYDPRSNKIVFTFSFQNVIKLSMFIGFSQSLF